MEKVLEVYRRPYDTKNPVLCMDESLKQLVKETMDRIPARPGREERIDYEYERCGVCNIFMANEPLAGVRIVEITERKTKTDWSRFLKQISEHYYGAEKITLVMDNLGTHKPGSFYCTYSPEEAKSLSDRFEFIYTPKHGSWLNIAEIELRVLMQQCLNRHIGTIEEVASESAAWSEYRNNMNATVNWQFTAEDARIRLKRLYPTLDI